MGQNRAHKDKEVGETIFEALNGPSVLSISLLVISIDKFFNNELSITAENQQTGLMFMGIHAVALTISEAFWDKNGSEGYEMFIKQFIDEDLPDRQFSKVAKQIHGWRNVLAHQFLSLAGHNIDYDYNMKEGYILNNKDLTINPSIYLNSYLNAFKESRIINYVSGLEKKEQDKIKQRILNKYLNK